MANAIKIEEYYEKIKKDHPEFKVILGNEIYLCRNGLNGENFSKENGDKYYHFILLAKDEIGHKQIRELSTRAWMRSYVSSKMRRVPTYYKDLQEIIGANPGHVIGSTACLGGFLPTKILDQNANESSIKNWILKVQEIFGKGNFYLEMQPSNNIDQITVNNKIIELGHELDVPFIITTDSHYLKKEDAPIHEAFLNSQDGDREVSAFYATTYLMDTEEIEGFMKDHIGENNLQEAYENILHIRDMCQDYSLKKPLKIPTLMWRTPITPIEEVKKYYDKIPMLEAFVNSDYIGDRVLTQLIVDRLESDSKLRYKASYDELNNNLEIVWKSSEVNKAHWSAYFLNLQKTLDICWNAGTLIGPGRGSGVGFYLLYILDIIQINPLWETTKLYSWRFLNPDRVSVLD